MGVFERYLTLWVALSILAEVLLGNIIPGLFSVIAELELAHVNLDVAVFIWVMIHPMMVQIGFIGDGCGRTRRGTGHAVTRCDCKYKPFRLVAK